MKTEKFYEPKLVDLEIKKPCDKELEYLFEKYQVDYPDKKGVNRADLYLGHPDSVLLDNGDILCAYPLGHGKGETVINRSTDGGKTWQGRAEGLPDNFKDTAETPTVYKLDFCDGSQKLVIINGRPNWGKPFRGNGFDVALSTSLGTDGKCDGKVWQPYENFFGSNAKRKKYYRRTGKWNCVVAMASLTRLKENGAFVDKWMGVFHSGFPFRVFKTVLTFGLNGEMEWSEPERLRYKGRYLESVYNFCEPEVVRSPDGNELAMLFRTNAKRSYSQVIFSADDGKTWSKPQNLSRELTGERHKAEYDPVSGKLVVTFRDSDWYLGREFNPRAFVGRGWVVWIGDYSDLHKGADGKGDYVVKLAHTYIDGQTEPQTKANSDTGYAGLTIDKNGNVVTMSYGRFKAECRDTFVIAKRFTVDDLNKFAEMTNK